MLGMHSDSPNKDTQRKLQLSLNVTHDLLNLLESLAGDIAPVLVSIFCLVEVLSVYFSESLPAALPKFSSYQLDIPSPADPVVLQKQYKAGTLTARSQARYSNQYYSVLAKVADQTSNKTSGKLEGTLLALLSPIHNCSVFAYEGFISEGLCSPSISFLVSDPLWIFLFGVG